MSHTMTGMGTTVNMLQRVLATPKYQSLEYPQGTLIKTGSGKSRQRSQPRGYVLSSKSRSSYRTKKTDAFSCNINYGPQNMLSSRGISGFPAQSAAGPSKSLNGSIGRQDMLYSRTSSELLQQADENLQEV